MHSANVARGKRVRLYERTNAVSGASAKQRTRSAAPGRRVVTARAAPNTASRSRPSFGYSQM